MERESSDSNFEPPPSTSRRTTASSRVLSLSRSLRQDAPQSSPSRADSELSSSQLQCDTNSSSSSSGMAATARRLKVVRHGLSVVNSRRFASASVGRELSSNFPFLSQPASSARYALSSRLRSRVGAKQWKTIPCLLNTPSMTRVPTREQMDQLCRKGLGTLWFDKDVDQLPLPQYYGADEVHFVLTCLYPPLVNIKYELCRAGGPSHHTIVPLAVDDEGMIPSLERPFRPYFSVNLLKERIGRKGRLYIRPLTSINLNSLPTVSAEHVSTF